MTDKADKAGRAARVDKAARAGTGAEAAARAIVTTTGAIRAKEGGSRVSVRRSISRETGTTHRLRERRPR